MDYVQLAYSFVFLDLKHFYYLTISKIKNTGFIMKNQVKSLINLVLLPFNKDNWTKVNTIKTCLILFSIKALLFQSHPIILIGLMTLYAFDMYVNKDKDLIVKDFNRKLAEIGKKMASLTARDSLEKKINKPNKRAW